MSPAQTRPGSVSNTTRAPRPPTMAVTAMSDQAADLAIAGACRLLMLPTIGQEHAAIAEAAARERLSHRAFLAEVLTAECDDRDARRRIRRVIEAKFPRPKRLDTFDVHAVPDLPPATLAHLASGTWIDAGQPLVLLGDSGTGKTHLLIALGTAAAEQGRRVRYVTTTALVNELVEAADDKQLSRVVARYARLDLLCQVPRRPPRRRRVGPVPPAGPARPPWASRPQGRPAVHVPTDLHTGADLLTETQRAWLTPLFEADEHVEVEATWGIYQRMITAYRQPDRKQERTLMTSLIDSISHAVPAALTEVLGRTLKFRAADVLAYFDWPGTSNGPTEAINGRLEHLRGSALGFRNLTNYIARSLLESGGFRPHLHPQL